MKELKLKEIWSKFINDASNKAKVSEVGMPWFVYLLIYSTLIFVPLISFFIGAHLCELYFETQSEHDLLLFAVCMIFTSFLFLAYFLRETVKDMRKTDKSTFYLYFIVIDVHQLIHFFAIIYSTIYLFNKTAFLGINNTSAVTIYLDMLYFSTVTFTTLGYGDIVPNSSLSKVFVMLEVFLFVIVLSFIILNFVKRSDISNRKNEEKE